MIRPGSGSEAISAVKLSEQLTADIDAWAEAHATVRSDAIRQLVELGLGASPSGPSPGSASRDPGDCQGNPGDCEGNPGDIKAQATRQIDQLLDPSLPAGERERRIRRLTEGPPEFSDQRIDLPRPGSEDHGK